MSEEQSLLDLHLEDVEEQQPVPGGDTYELQIIKAELKPSKDGGRQVLNVIYKIVGHPMALSVFDYLSLPNETDDENARYMFKLQMKRFYEAFGLNFKSPGNPAEWKGKTAKAVLSIQEYEGVPSNKVKKWIKEG